MCTFSVFCLGGTDILKQEIILDMFFDLLNINEPEWHQTFIDGRRLTSSSTHSHMARTSA